jgi:adenylate cyclase
MSKLPIRNLPRPARHRARSVVATFGILPFRRTGWRYRPRFETVEVVRISGLSRPARTDPSEMSVIIEHNREIGRSWKQILKRTLDFGANSNDATECRRKTLVNFASYSAALSSGLYAIIFAAYDFGLLWPMVVGNLICVVVYFSTPFWHRWGVNTSATVFTLTAYTSLFVFLRLLGKDSGIHLNFMAASALAFVLYGASQMRTIVVLLLLGLILHLVNVLCMQHPIIPMAPHRRFLDTLYAFSAGSSMLIVASSVCYAFQLAADAEEQSERLLLNILPESIASRLKAHPSELIVDRFEQASVLFADIVDFTPKCIDMSPKEMVALLNEVFCEFDSLTVKHGAEKIKTIGDAYMAATGIPVPFADNAASMVALAIEMLRTIEDVSRRNGMDLEVRIGIATGPITAGVIGTTKFAYDVWSSTVNLASRLESTGEQGRIHICQKTKQAIGDRFDAELASPRELKGIGVTTTWFVAERCKPAIA